MHELHEGMHFPEYDNEVLEASLSMKSYWTSARRSKYDNNYLSIYCWVNEIGTYTNNCIFVGLMVGSSRNIGDPTSSVNWTILSSV